MTHDLIRHDSRHLECRICGQTWERTPRSECPGLKLYSKYSTGSLLTEKQLDFAGYHTTGGRLPPAIGCYREYNGYLTLLYDPTYAVKKQARKRKVNVCVSDIAWPLSCVAFLETALALKQVNRSDYYHFADDLSRMAFQFLSFTASDMEQAGGHIQLAISPVLLHRSYGSFSQRHRERERFIRHIISAYQLQRGMP